MRRRKFIKAISAAAGLFVTKKAVASNTSPAIDRFSGYRYGEEDYSVLYDGLNPEYVLTVSKAAMPKFNPYVRPFLRLQNQGRMGSCVGHAMSHSFQHSLVNRFGIQADFSRMAAYITAQAHSKITGDRGATISGAMLAAADGICFEREWPYPESYTTSVPATSEGKMDISMDSGRVEDADLAWELLANGCVIMTGIAWNQTFEREICDNHRPGGGGHSTTISGLDKKTGHAVHHNSWGNWQGDGRNLWTKDFFRQILKNDPWAVFAVFSPADLQVPDGIASRV